MGFCQVGKCIDCGAEIIRRSPNTKRCRECQKKADIKTAKRCIERQKAKRESVQEKNTKVKGAVYINGHPQICRHVESCSYGGRKADGCGYVLATGHSRKSEGLFIVDGKCAAYSRGRRKKANATDPMPLVYGRGKKYLET